MNPFQTTSDEGICVLSAKHFRRQAQRLAAQLDGIRAAEDIEPVHRARVASRRLRAGLRMFESYLEPEVHARWRKHVRRITSGLGDARDKDVQIEFLCHVLSELDDPAFFPGVVRLLAELEKQRERLQPAVLKAVDRIERSGVLAEMQGALKEVRGASEEAKPSARSEAMYGAAERRINAQLDELLSREAALADPHAIADHHAMRIAAKRMRYTLEIVKSPYQGGLDKMIDVVKRLQTLLGDIHDCDVWAERLAEFAQRQHDRVIDRFGHEGPYARLSAGIECLRDRRAHDRQLLFQELRDYWAQLERDRVWDDLRRRAGAPGEPPTATPVPNPTLRCEEDRAGRPERGNGRSLEASLAGGAPSPESE